MLLVNAANYESINMKICISAPILKHMNWKKKKVWHFIKEKKITYLYYATQRTYIDLE